jgi:hypothetical protein
MAGPGRVHARAAMDHEDPINLDTYRSGKSLESMISRLQNVIALNDQMRRENPDLAAGCEQRIVAAETAIARLTLLAAVLERGRRAEHSG